MKQFLEVGKINNTHGVKGEVKMLLWCDGIDYVKQFKVLYFDDEGKSSVKLLNARPQKNTAILKLDGIDTFEKAQELKGRILYGNRDDAQIEDGSIYIADIIGCKIADFKTGDIIGEVCDVLNYGSCDIYDVKKDGRHTLIPAIDDVIADIDTKKQIIKIIKMKGLFDED